MIYRTGRHYTKQYYVYITCITFFKLYYVANHKLTYYIPVGLGANLTLTCTFSKNRFCTNCIFTTRSRLHFIVLEIEFYLKFQFKFHRSFLYKLFYFIPYYGNVTVAIIAFVSAVADSCYRLFIIRVEYL